MSVTQSSARHQRQRPVTRTLCGQTWEGRHCVIPDPSLVLRSPIILFFSVSQMLEFALCAQNYNSSIGVELTSLLFLELLVTTLCYETVVVPWQDKEKKNRKKMLVADEADPLKAHWKQRAGGRKFGGSTPQSWGLADSMRSLSAALSNGNTAVWGCRAALTNTLHSPSKPASPLQTNLHGFIYLFIYLFIYPETSGFARSSTSIPVSLFHEVLDKEICVPPQLEIPSFAVIRV